VTQLDSKELGKRGEQLAAKYLAKSGFKIIERNYRCRLGEVDLILSKNDQLIFVEVKTRSSIKYGQPAEAVNSKKKANYFRLATHYVSFKRLNDINLRFDVIEIMYDADGTYKINHIPDAF